MTPEQFINHMNEPTIEEVPPYLEPEPSFRWAQWMLSYIAGTDDGIDWAGMEQEELESFVKTIFDGRPCLLHRDKVLCLREYIRRKRREGE